MEGPTPRTQRRCTLLHSNDNSISNAYWLVRSRTAVSQETLHREKGMCRFPLGIEMRMAAQVAFCCQTKVAYHERSRHECQAYHEAGFPFQKEAIA